MQITALINIYIMKRVRFKKYVKIEKYENNTIDFVKDGLSGMSMNYHRIIDEFINICKTNENTYESITTHLSKELSIEQEYVVQFIETLFQNNVIEYFNDDDIVFLERYSRQLMYYDSLKPQMDFEDVLNFQRSLFNKHIILLGVGGIGNYAGLSLVASGIGKLTLIDGDIIELSNLNRQIIFNEDNLGEYKVDVAKKHLEKINKDCKINSICKKINSESDLYSIEDEIKGADFIFLSADTPIQLPNWVMGFSFKHNIPCITAGYVGSIGFIDPLTNSSEKNSSTNRYKKDHNKTQLNVDLWNTSSSINNAIIANIAVAETIKLLSGITDNILNGKLMVINLKDYSIKMYGKD